MTWLDSAEVIPSDRSRGGTYQDGVPWRFTGHTTEAIPDDLDGARAMAERHPYPPQLWYWPEHRWLGQTVPLDRSGFALLHPRGTPHTNKMRALQCEVIGRAADTPYWPDEWWHNIGIDVIAPIIAAGYPLNLDHQAPTTGPAGYGADGAVRMSRAEWERFDGLCVHANVPDNHHWDMGHARLDLIANAAKEAHMPTIREIEELLDRKLDEKLGTDSKPGQNPGTETVIGRFLGRMKESQDNLAALIREKH